MRPDRPLRLVGACLVALALAIVAAAQSSSGVLLRENPAAAVQLMPQNGQAWERFAALSFVAGLKVESDIVPSAKNANSMARRAFSAEPLSPKSLAILALAEDDPQRKFQILEFASRLNKRDLLLQGMVLESRIARQDYNATLTTLNHILSVHPEQGQRFFPVLASAFGDDAAATALGAVLDNSFAWHEHFLEFAARDSVALPNIARLRMTREDVDPKIDQRLISGLVANGDLVTAHSIYALATSPADDGSRGAAISWNSDYPPFDWQLANKAELRAQTAISGTAIEVFVRSGNGGIVAERLIELPIGPAQLHIAHSLSPAAQVKDVRLQLSCPSDMEPVLDQPFRIRPMDINLPNLGQRCRFARLAIYARSWSGRSSIRGEINQLKIVRN